ncbi:MAG TPA: hypothetical protein DEB17_08390 [Chlorobaculum sp.]|uniref:Uncharacterized protein n=1 Tax=Chlorobaculum tepidum (strain ATCC 49652 / DSM 12025 / NBRC 103806 / TLS) TaxID=194439 RepID=Q8KDB7_CHLTE|nr:hypothetical protein CT1137 [Chlorobaculum tepidum TLS]HBU23990.1 hypothetical protein [Chlorobaculum sp.]
MVTPFTSNKKQYATGVWLKKQAIEIARKIQAGECSRDGFR